MTIARRPMTSRARLFGDPTWRASPDGARWKSDAPHRRPDSRSALGEHFRQDSGAAGWIDPGPAAVRPGRVVVARDRRAGGGAFSLRAPLAGGGGQRAPRHAPERRTPAAVLALPEAAPG